MLPAQARPAGASMTSPVHDPAVPDQALGSPDPAATAVPLQVTKVRLDGLGARADDRFVAVETAVNIVYGTVPYAVMMMTPADLEDFGVGFSLTEGVIAARSDVRGTEVESDENGLRLVVDL